MYKLYKAGRSGRSLLKQLFKICPGDLVEFDREVSGYDGFGSFVQTETALGLVLSYRVGEVRCLTFADAKMFTLNPGKVKSIHARVQGKSEVKYNRIMGG